jgi:hypothetical protein
METLKTSKQAVLFHLSLSLPSSLPLQLTSQRLESVCQSLRQTSDLAAAVSQFAIHAPPSASWCRPRQILGRKPASQFPFPRPRSETAKSSGLAAFSFSTLSTPFYSCAPLSTARGQASKKTRVNEQVSDFLRLKPLTSMTKGPAH